MRIVPVSVPATMKYHLVRPKDIGQKVCIILDILNDPISAATPSLKSFGHSSWCGEGGHGKYGHHACVVCSINANGICHILFWFLCYGFLNCLMQKKNLFVYVQFHLTDLHGMWISDNTSCFFKRLSAYLMVCAVWERYSDIRTAYVYVDSGAFSFHSLYRVTIVQFCQFHNQILNVNSNTTPQRIIDTNYHLLNTRL